MTFNLVSLAWVFFRAGSLGEGLYIYRNIFNFYSNLLVVDNLGIYEFLKYNVILGNDIRFSVNMMIILSIMVFISTEKLMSVLSKKPIFRWPVYYLLFMSILILRLDETKFIYFKF